MARSLRIEFPGAWYHIINRGANRQNIFLSDQDRQRFLEILEECHELWGLECACFCLMENHYHLLVRTPRGSLSRIMRHLAGVYTQQFNRKHGRDGPLFRGRYKSILVDQETYGLGVSRYIHLNPVKAKVVFAPEDYPWSSYRFYFERESPSFLHRELLLSFFGNGQKGTQELRKFTEAGIDEEMEKFYASKRPHPVLGGNKFSAWVKSHGYVEPQKNKIQFSESILARPPSLGRILNIVSQAYEIPLSAIVASQRGRSNEARFVAIYLCKRLSGKSLEEIANNFGRCTDKAVSKAAHAIERSLVSDPKLKSRVEKIRESIALVNEIRELPAAEEVEVET
ncbi:MAG: transposase [Elusimicrobia bacterium]|nr:transposase [Elusimicrobiota bacterium]